MPVPVASNIRRGNGIVVKGVSWIRLEAVAIPARVGGMSSGAQIADIASDTDATEVGGIHYAQRGAHNQGPTSVVFGRRGQGEGYRCSLAGVPGVGVAVVGADADGPISGVHQAGNDLGVSVVSYGCGIGEAIRGGVHRRFNIDILELTVFQPACEVLMSVHLSVPSDIQYLKAQDGHQHENGYGNEAGYRLIHGLRLAEVYSCGSKGPQME